MMTIRQCFLTRNNCYIAGEKHTVSGIMLHSTGADNPNLRRYVQPDDGLLGQNPYNNDFNQPMPGGQNVCVHAFIGLDKNGDVQIYQTLPWDMVGWHSGSGKKGNANYMGYVGVEICEDSLTDAGYFARVYDAAVDLCAQLCRDYALDPLTDGVLICHSEGYTRGIASNHGDVMHWFPRHGKSMDTFRAAVAKRMEPGDVNGDGRVDGKDATLLMRRLAGWSGEIDEAAADMDGNGKVNGKDATLLLRRLAGWEDGTDSSGSVDAAAIDVSALPVLRYGTTGDAVRYLQTRLISQGYSCGASGADGSFGPATLDAVKRFQGGHALAADGSVGPGTWRELVEA